MPSPPRAPGPRGACLVVGVRGVALGVQRGLGASVPQARWGCCYRGDKAFRPGNMAKPDREREQDRRTGLQGPHSSRQPLPVTLPSTAPAGPPLCPPPHRGPNHLWGLQARRVAGPSREASAATRPRAQLTGREGAGPVSAPGPGTVLTSAQGSNPLLRELGQVQGYGKVKETARFMVLHRPHALAEGTCLTADPGGSASQGPHRAGSKRPLCPALCGPVSLAGAASLALVSESRPV